MSKALQPWQIISSTVIHHTPWIEVVEEECLADGQKLTYTSVKRRDEGPQIIAREDDGRVWLVQQYRHPIRKIVWQFPAEGKFPEESWESAAQRGIQEELGLEAREFVDLRRLFVDPGLLQQQTHVFLATGLKPITVEKLHTEEGEVEDLRVQAFTLKEIDQLIEHGEICDNWTLAGLFLLQRYLARA
jgi:ADP-ribose pyrophosphatase